MAYSLWSKCSSWSLLLDFDPSMSVYSIQCLTQHLTASDNTLQVEAVENHMPEIIMVDEIGTEAEALACRTIAERGVQLVATAHGQLLENLIKNPTLSDLVGGIQSVTLGMPMSPFQAVKQYCSCENQISVMPEYE